MKVKLIGCRTDYEYRYGGDTSYERQVYEVVATFDCKKYVERYIEDSRLKHPTNRERPFKQKSLLSLFEEAMIEEFDSPPPHNPQMEKRSK